MHGHDRHYTTILSIIHNISNKFFWHFADPCISVYLSQYLTNLMHKICFTISFISCLYMFRAHVLIISSSKLHYTATGIITPIGVKIALHSLRYHHTYRCDDTWGCVMQFWPPDDEHMCSKHVEAWNKTYCKTKMLSMKLVNYWGKYTEMHGQQNVKKNPHISCTYSFQVKHPRCVSNDHRNI